MPYEDFERGVVVGELYQRNLWTFAGSTGQPVLAVIFLDAELYIERVHAHAIVRQLQQEGSLPATVAAFVSGHSAAARHADFVCHHPYATFVAEDVVGWVRGRYPGVEHIILAGLSLSGLAAGYIATRFPNTFCAAICQSPSFWWENGRFAQELPVATGQRPKYWICVGDRETEKAVSHAPSGMYQAMSQIEGCELACEAFRAQGYRFQYRLYEGGHDPACWTEDLAIALPWALA